MNGHDKLISDLTEVLSLAQQREFHDFDNKRFGAPKNALVAYLDTIKKKTIEGIYDN